MQKLRDFPGSPVVTTLPSNAWGTGSVPGWEMEIPHAMQEKKKKSLKNRSHRKAHWDVKQESIFLKAAVLETQ